jgi:hypothetical protein
MHYAVSKAGTGGCALPVRNASRTTLPQHLLASCPLIRAKQRLVSRHHLRSADKPENVVLEFAYPGESEQAVKE